tara:strand:+ start:777 stop:1673 length:897 start_codon:yes stop_codon:yes gene_type:complete
MDFNPKVGTHLNFSEEETLSDVILHLDDIVPGYKIPNFQVYLGKKNNCEIRKLSKEDIDISLRIIGNRGFFIHSSLINYLSNLENFRRYCKRRIITELRQVKKFPLAGVVIHPGSKNCRGVRLELTETLDNIIHSIVDIYQMGHEDLGYLYLENSAGEGSKVFKNMEEMKYIIKKLELFKDINGEPISNNVKICIDTCHLFAAGDYDLSKVSQIKKFKKDFSREIGMKYLKLIHLNDSKHEFGCRKDVHEILGKGYIWKSPRILKTFFEEFKNIPYVCETRSFKECVPMIEEAKELMD